MRHRPQAGFTLIELLVVIAIIAILATVLIMILNPTELLKQARDATRLSDMNTLKTSIGQFIADTGGTGSLGTPGTVYLSLPDPTATTTAGTDCEGLGFVASMDYHCAASSTYRNANGTGWIPINLQSLSYGSPLSALPVDPTNSSSSGYYYAYIADGSGFKVSAALESAKYQSTASSDGGTDASRYEAGSSLALAAYGFPFGWVKVPGNSTFGTSDFWVMKYDAKCVQNGVPLTSPDTGAQTYNNGSAPCTGSNGTIASAASGYPITFISHTTAVSYCQAIGAHLLTNDEYMTIVTNAANQGSNWSGGSVGSGYMYSGHNDNAPADALEASTDDTQGYYGETNTGGNQRRTYTLSNGSVIWDMAGNVFEHVQRSTNNVGDNTSAMTLPSCSNNYVGWEWCQYGNSAAPYINAWTSDVAQPKVGPTNTSWNSTQGVGQVLTYGSGGSQSTTIFLRGASWSDGSVAGPFALSLIWDTGNTGYDAGFRCAR